MANMTRLFMMLSLLLVVQRAIAAPVQSLRKSSGEVHLNFVDTGNPHGIPVLLVHAFPLNQSMWNDQVDALRKIARVVTFDIRGLGKSDSTSPYTLEFIVDD